MGQNAGDALCSIKVTKMNHSGGMLVAVLIVYRHKSAYNVLEEVY
jgi:hypothetical protein